MTIHEAGIASNIIKIVENTARSNQLVRIQKVELEIGPFSGVQIDALQFALNVLCKETILAKSEFDFHSSPLLLYCRLCHNEYAAEPEDLICPGCLKADFEIKQGQTMLIKAIHGEKIKYG